MVYISIRSFNGYKGCYPSYDSIAERAGCGRSYAINAVKRLERSGAFEVVHSKRRDTSNRYTFEEPTKENIFIFEQIPYSFFNTDLSLHDRSMLLCLRQFANRVCVGGIRHKSVKKMSKELGLSYKQVYNQLQSLINKKYITEEKNLRGGGVTYWFTNRVDWNWDYSKIRNPVPDKFDKVRVS